MVRHLISSLSEKSTHGSSRRAAIAVTGFGFMLLIFHVFAASEPDAT
jgi:hypothetical protein